MNKETEKAWIEGAKEFQKRAIEEMEKELKRYKEIECSEKNSTAKVAWNTVVCVLKEQIELIKNLKPE